MSDNKELQIYLSCVYVGEIYETPNGSRWLVCGDGDVVYMVCIKSIIGGKLGHLIKDRFLKIGNDFAVVDKDNFFSVYKLIKE